MTTKPQKFLIEDETMTQLSFEGSIIAEVESPVTASTPRWSVLVIYRTVGGTFICQHIGRTNIEGESDRMTTKITSNPHEVSAFFGEVAQTFNKHNMVKSILTQFHSKVDVPVREIP